MLDIYSLIPALISDQFDDITVKELKAKFTLPDSDPTHVEMFPEGRTGRTGMSIYASDFGVRMRNATPVIVGDISMMSAKHMAEMLPSDKLVLVIDDNSSHIQAPENYPLKNFNDAGFDITKTVIATTGCFPDHQAKRREKKQQYYRARNHKK